LGGDFIAEINNRIANRIDLSPSEAELLDVYLDALGMIHKKISGFYDSVALYFSFRV
jgi:hypothetical protein